MRVFLRQKCWSASALTLTLGNLIAEVGGRLLASWSFISTLPVKTGTEKKSKSRTKKKQTKYCLKGVGRVVLWMKTSSSGSLSRLPRLCWGLAVYQSWTPRLCLTWETRVFALERENSPAWIKKKRLLVFFFRARRRKRPTPCLRSLLGWQRSCLRHSLRRRRALRFRTCSRADSARSCSSLKT